MNEYKAWERHRQAATIRRRRVVALIFIFAVVVLIGWLAGGAT